MNGAVSEPLTTKTRLAASISVVNRTPTKCHGLVCNEDTGKIVISLEGVEDCLESR